MNEKLPKSARLHHRSLQERLFAEGEKLHDFPVKLIWHALTAEELEANFRSRVPEGIGPVQVLVSVPKKKRRKAVDRVLMRRRLREVFRHKRPAVVAMLAGVPAVRTLSIGLIYMKEANAKTAELDRKLENLLRKLAAKVKERYEEDCHGPAADPD